jgi:hypothetical protein
MQRERNSCPVFGSLVWTRRIIVAGTSQVYFRPPILKSSAMAVVPYPLAADRRHPVRSLNGRRIRQR